MADSTPFTLINSSDSFSAKSNDIFGGLSVIEKKHEAYQKAHSEDDMKKIIKPDPEDEDSKLDARPQRNWRGRDERDQPQRRHQEFIRPYPPSRNRHRGGNHGNRRTPDFKVNPERWTKYSLEDVDGKDMTESSNTRAAFEFLEERRKMREMEADPEAFKSANVEETACSRGAITFVRKKKDKTESSDEKTKCVVLPKVDVLGDDASGAAASGDDDKDKQNVQEKVSFKSKKAKRRNIRIRYSDEEDDQNG